MRVVVVGSGGREAAIRWACARYGHDVVAADSYDPIVDAPCDLVIVGPEGALVEGTADRCAAHGIPCFGPTADLARLESSKSFTRRLADHLGLPSPIYATFVDADAAIAWWKTLGRPVVVKFDGLAAGKGVVVPRTDPETEDAIRRLTKRGEIVLEEQLTGPECSLIALCDGTTARALPMAQDHKRLGEGDSGPNTGGMGAYAPAPIPYDAAMLTDLFITPVLHHLRAAGTPYVGVLYAGLMLTSQGPKLLEFNCRFGDPEAQAILPLLDCDLAEVALACTAGNLSRTTIATTGATACTVVAAAPGYPESPQLGGSVTGLEGADDDASLVFPSGTDGTSVTGGRVVAVTGLGDDLTAARAAAYARLGSIRFDGMQVRNDIGWRAIGAELRSYASAGVDIDEGARAVERMRAAVERTHGPSVLAGLGSFGGAFSASVIKSLDDPVLVASTDGVGTKVELAARLGRHRGVGIDIVNHCIDDVLVQGARPLFFLDYIASSTLDANHVAGVVSGMAEACEAAGCALLGGETAEMPGVYAPGAFDIAGTLIGLVDRSDLLPRPDVGVGDVLIGLASSGPHTNGYSLLRKVFAWVPMDAVPAGFDRSLADSLLEPHRSYLDVLTPALASGRVKALAHITGGGLPENLPRVLPDGCDAVVALDSWPVPALFRLVSEVCTSLDTRELYRTLNMGIGMVVVCSPDDVDVVQSSIDEPTWVIGHLVDGAGRVHLV